MCDFNFYCCDGNVVDKHEIFGASNRKKSKKNNWAVLNVCRNCHSFWHLYMTKKDRFEYKAHYQRKLMEENNWTEQEFRDVFGKSYL